MRGLDQSEIQLVGDCLRAAADGPFFEDWEFATLFGLERAEVKRIAREWPAVDADDASVSLAVQNSLNNLLGYPHGMDADLKASVPGSPLAIEQVLARWRAAGQYLVGRTIAVSEELNVETSSLPVGAAELLRYFEGVGREYPDPHWRKGAEMCRRWLDLTSGPVSQQDVDEFVRDLSAEPSPGSGWLDLGMQFRAWARDRGLTV